MLRRQRLETQKLPFSYVDVTFYLLLMSDIVLLSKQKIFAICFYVLPQSPCLLCVFVYAISMELYGEVDWDKNTILPSHSNVCTAFVLPLRSKDRSQQQKNRFQQSIPSFLSRPLTTQQLHGRIQVRYQSIPICLLVFMWFVRSFVLQGYIKGYISHQHQKLVVSKQNPFPALTSFLQSVRTCVTPASSKLDIHRAFIHLDVASLLTHSAKQEFAGTFLLKYSKVRKVSVYSD